MNKFWDFKTVKNEKDNTENIELRIEGDIVSNNNEWLYEWFGEDCTSPNSFKTELNNYKNKDITVWVNSFGGDVFAGTGIYNALKEHKGKVTVKIDEKAMSIASIIAMAGDEVLMSPVSILMIHNPWSQAQGDMHDMRKMADILDTIKETLINAYCSKTGKSKEEISEMMDNETWMSANVAIKEGFADDILYKDDNSAINNLSFNRNKILNYSNSIIDKFAKQEQKENNDLELAQAKLRLLNL